jgi:thiosulfate dehydrogenase
MMKRLLLSSALLVVGAAAGVAVVTAGVFKLDGRFPFVAFARHAEVFQPPTDDQIPNNEFGAMVRLGKNIFRDPGTYAAKYVGNDLRCTNCHLLEGRLAGSSPLWAAYLAYPAYRSKNGHVNTFQERLQGCFRYSMNGKAPPLGDPVLVALESYAYFLAKGLPVGKNVPGRGFPALAKPASAPDYKRGEAVYAKDCAVCHGADGQGQDSGGKNVFPPLWGPRSYNWGAGMTSVKNAANFIRANMPLTLGNTLGEQEAWDVAYFIDGQSRPQDPRFDGDLEATRKKHHNSPFDLYGTTVNGVLLGDPANTPPSGTVPTD